MPKIDKQFVCRRFRRAASGYDRQAMIQHRVADRLLGMLIPYIGREPLRVLEIGCCTGLLTGKLLKSSIKVRSLVLNDLMPDFAERLPRNLPVDELRFLPGDIEKLSLPGSFDLIISSSTFHWLHDLERTLVRLLAALRPGGLLAFSLYGPGNLPEIKELTGVGLNYLPLSAIASMLEARCLLEERHEEKEVFLFPSPRDVLNHLRQTGVNAVDTNPTPWTRRELQTFCRKYEKRFYMDQSVRLTYHPLYFVARRFV